MQDLGSAGGQRGRNTVAECNALALGRVDPRFRTRQSRSMEKWPGFRTPSPRALVESLATVPLYRRPAPPPLEHGSAHGRSQRSSEGRLEWANATRHRQLRGSN